MTKDVCNNVGLLCRMCQRILSYELNKKPNAAKYVPRLMGSDQKEICIAVCTELKTAPSFYYSQRWNWRSRGNVLTALKRSRLNHRMDEDTVAKWIPAVLPVMEISLGSLYQYTTRLLWRRRRRI